MKHHKDNTEGGRYTSSTDPQNPKSDYIPGPTENTSLVAILGAVFANGVAFERDELDKTKFSHDYLTIPEARAAILATHIPKDKVRAALQPEPTEIIEVSHTITMGRREQITRSKINEKRNELKAELRKDLGLEE